MNEEQKIPQKNLVHWMRTEIIIEQVAGRSIEFEMLKR